MDINSKVQWLQQHTALSTLPIAVLEAIAAQVEPITVLENRRLVLEDTAPAALYFLYSGRMERYRTQEDTAAAATSLLPGSILYLQELLLDQPAEHTTITLSDCELWQIPRKAFLALAQQYPEISRTFSQQLASELREVSSQLAQEQTRQAELRPYLVPKVRRGVIGSSRYAVRLRQQIRQASGDREPVLIFGEPGLGKDNIAALIHFGSSDRRQPLIKLDCDTIQVSGAELLGREGGSPGLLEWIGEGTLMLNNVQDLPQRLMPVLVELLDTGQYRPLSRSDEPPTLRNCRARIILTAERTLPQLEGQLMGHTIKVPPLRVRKADIAAQVQYYQSLLCRARNIEKSTLDPRALRRLQSYDFPGNISELESMVERALIQSEGGVLTEEVFWSDGSKARRFRLNLLNLHPWLRHFLRSPWWPDRLNYSVVLLGFPLVLGILFLGPQQREVNIGLTLFWAGWWPVVLVLFPFLGRIWCAVCPFMVYGEIAQRLSLKAYPRALKPWPRKQADRWGGWFLFGLFALILLWEELWNLENVAYLSGCLLLLITAGAVVFSLLFERRFWCRYLCPIGGMNGLFAKLSMVELRAQQGICSATCTTYQCYKGGPQKGEGQETMGCPVYSHPAQLQDNRDCVLCMTCLKACPHRSVELNLRPPGIELWTTHKPTFHEVALLFLLLGAVPLHRLPQIQAQLQSRWGITLDLNSFGIHALAAAATLLMPGAIALLAHQIVVRVSRLKPRPFLELAYGYLPLVLGGSLAHYLYLGLNEGGKALPITAATFGYAGVGLPMAIAPPAVVGFLQGVTLIIAVWLSLFLTQRIARQPITQLWPQHGAIAGLGIWLWRLILG
ncbi:MAG: sigma 54-interacting transcriptional regulator [Elainellaceae cyanobacterium]